MRDRKRARSLVLKHAEQAFLPSHHRLSLRRSQQRLLVAAALVVSDFSPPTLGAFDTRIASEVRNDFVFHDSP
jgi:hypothetical protein